MNAKIPQPSRALIPYDLEAEKACLGALLLKNKLIDELHATVTWNDFYDERHQIILRSITEHREKDGKSVIDLITLKNILNERKALKQAGGVTYLSELIDHVPSISHVNDYAKIVKNKALLRHIINICEEGKASAQENLKVEDILETIQQKLFEMATKDYREYKRLREIFKESLDLIAERMQLADSSKAGHDLYIGIPTRYRLLDMMMGSMVKENLIIIGARPGMGKTAFALSILQNISISPRDEDKICAGYFSLEMSSTELLLRLLSSEAKIQGDKFRRSHLNQAEWTLVMKAGEPLLKAPVYIDDTPALTVNELSAKARKMVNDGVQIIFVDYLQLMSHTESISREQQIAAISRRLKGIARDLSIPVVALTQLNRAPEARPSKIPLLSDIRESGSIEQDADVVCFIHRADYYRDPDEEADNIAEIKIAKNRHGQTGTVKLLFHSNYTRFENYEDSSAPG